MKPFGVLLFISLIFSTLSSFGQDTLPSFSVVNQSGKVIISWVNPFDSLVQISIQRSPDSLRGYKTIMTIPDPTSITNGYLDNKAPNSTQFYRIYVQRPRGSYFFTKIKRPGLAGNRPYAQASNGNNRNNINGNGNGKLRPPEQKNLFTPSIFVFTNPEGNVVIALPEAKSMLYSIKFFRETGEPIFQMAQVKESVLTLDKSNFLRSGWFNFELYENNVLKEKSKFFIPKDRQ
jgi:hypothetical protein